MQVVHPPARCSGDSGTALVEAAFILPVFIYLIFGIFEGGFVMRDYLAMGNVTGVGTRSVAVFGAKWDADYNAVQNMMRAGAAIPRSTITRIVVFNAGQDGRTALTSGCQNGSASSSVGSQCNVYVVADFTRPQAEWNCSAGSPYEGTSPSRFWCPVANSLGLGRHDAQTGINMADYVGVYVEVNHRMLTGLFGPNRVMRDTSLTRIEPVTNQ